MDPGKINQRILIQKNTDEQNDYGELTDAKKEILKCWCGVRNKSGKEQFEASVPYAKVITSFIIRYRKNIEIDTTMEIVYRDKIYNIIYVDNYNFSNDYIEITAEGDANG